ncbi:hypothetical protein [Streptomyces sp. NPDC046985]|uniref:hypothetical protein n=1 Tax=Streptomyces sp. NPDC046985 TaxID=3155377 RepID=UPI0033C2BD29
MTTVATTGSTSRARGLTGAARIAVPALLGALALTACDGGGGNGHGGGASASAPSTAPGGGASDSGAGGSDGGGSGSPSAEAGGLDGSWLATSGGRAVVLIVTGGKAALFSTDRTTCTGAAHKEAGKAVIRLGSCKGRSVGTVESVNKTTLRVTWKGDPGKETYTRSTGGALPSGLPTPSLGS